MDLWNACMHVGVIVNVGFVRRNGGRRGWTRLSERRRQEVEVEDGNDDVNEDDEFKERDDVDVGFDDFVTNGSGKEVEDEINDVVGTIVTMNKKCIYTINVDSTRVQGETEGGSLAS
jgi:hypothetical protein